MSNTLFRTVVSFSLAGASVLALSAAARAQDSAANTFQDAVGASKVLFNARLRYEGVDQDSIQESADALTYRLRIGFETGEFLDTKFLVDFDHIEALVDDYNSTTNGRGQFPVVADPEGTELNRIQLTNTSLPDTTVTLGRQRIIFDDSRFVGNVGWRQNEQTFDAVRVTNQSLGDVTINAVYLNQVNRIFGDESAAGRWEGDTVLVNAAAPTPLGKLVGFGYLIDVDELGGAPSSQTYGARLSGKHDVGGGAVAYALSGAVQSDYASSNIDYEAEFYSVDAAYSANSVTVGGGYEVLGGDDARGFQTPLATLHKFQGFADKFLVTPAAGIQDLYAKAGYGFGDVGPLKGLKATAIYHDFSSDVGSIDYGSEIDFVASAKLGKLGLVLKYADYSADEFSDDTQKLWFQVDYAF